MMVAPSRQMVICWLKCTCDKDCNDGGPLRADGDYVGSGSYSSFVPSPFALSTDTLPFLNLFFPPGLAELPTSMGTAGLPHCFGWWTIKTFYPLCHLYSAPPGCAFSHFTTQYMPYPFKIIEQIAIPWPSFAWFWAKKPNCENYEISNFVFVFFVIFCVKSQYRPIYM